MIATSTAGKDFIELSRVQKGGETLFWIMRANEGFNTNGDLLISAR